MSVFGIELRKVGNTDNLYRDVDLVLQKHKCELGTVGDMAKVHTVAHALHKMLKQDGYFSVCTLDNCAKVCNVCISSERKIVYNAAHCISWNMMTTEYRQLLTAMILDDFRGVLTHTE